MNDNIKQLEHNLLDNILPKTNNIITEDNPFSNWYEHVDHPKHYNNYDIEVIDMMEKIWGLNATIQFCLMNAFKYRMRIGLKPDNTIHQDLQKEHWYLNKANQLKLKLKN